MKMFVKVSLALGVIFVLALTPALPAFAQGGVVHVVQPGENLFRIGLRYGVTVDALMAANGLSSANRVYSGQRLLIPSGPSGSTEGGSAAPSGSPAAPAGGVHVVQRGENLFRIALRYGLTTQALAQANGIVNLNHVYAGQRLVIPGRGGAASPAPSPAPSSAPTGGRWIDVDLSAQRLTAYQGSTPVRSTLVSTGLPSTPTPPGQYRIYVKYTSKHMSGPGYSRPNVPHAMFFYRGYSIHGTYWHSNFGHPMSHGCINLPQDEARWLFNWASVGTVVKIHR